MGTENELTLRSLDEETETSYCEANFDDTVVSSALTNKKNNLIDKIPLFNPSGSYQQESKAFYHYHKILSSNQYMLGLKV